MPFEKLLHKHKQYRKVIRTYLVMFKATKQESYLDRATDSYRELHTVHQEFKEETGCCPREALLEHHKSEMEHQQKLVDLQKFIDEQPEPTKTEKETESLKYGKVTWRKGA